MRVQQCWLLVGDWTETRKAARRNDGVTRRQSSDVPQIARARMPGERQEVCCGGILLVAPINCICILGSVVHILADGETKVRREKEVGPFLDNLMRVTHTCRWRDFQSSPAR